MRRRLFFQPRVLADTFVDWFSLYAEFEITVKNLCSNTLFHPARPRVWPPSVRAKYCSPHHSGQAPTDVPLDTKSEWLSTYGRYNDITFCHKACEQFLNGRACCLARFDKNELVFMRYKHRHSLVASLARLARPTLRGSLLQTTGLVKHLRCNVKWAPAFISTRWCREPRPRHAAPTMPHPHLPFC